MAGKKPALGRGLDSLFGDIETIVSVNKDGEPGAVTGNPADRGGNAPGTVNRPDIFVDIDEIKPNAMQPRQVFDPEKIDELAASIEAHGVIQPVLLRKAENGYELVTGERRWRAARKAGLKSIPAVIREVSDEENALFAIIENMQREDLNTIEEAAAYQGIIQRYGMTQEGLARAVGKSRPYIANTLRALSMQDEIVEMLRSEVLTLGHANALGSVKDAERQLELAKKIAKHGLSVREAERLAALAEKNPVKRETKTVRSDEIRMVEQELTSVTGVRVKINGTSEKGNVELRYYDRQGLEEIIDLLRKAGTSGR